MYPSFHLKDSIKTENRFKIYFYVLFTMFHSLRVLHRVDNPSTLSQSDRDVKELQYLLIYCMPFNSKQKMR